MRGLKGLVIGLGVLIGIGLTVVVVTVFNRMGTSAGTVAGTAAGTAGAAESGAPGTPREAFGDVKIALPAGATVLRTEIADGRLVVHLTSRHGGARVLVIDLASGKTLGTVEVAPGSRLQTP